jgi:predicted permease
MLDLRVALRMLAATPAFLVGSVLCLALGLGTTVTVVAVWQSAVLATSVGVPTDGVVALTRFVDGEARPDYGVTETQAVALEQEPGLDAVTTLIGQELLVVGPNATRQRFVERIDDDYFTVFTGVVALGRPLARAGASEVVISHRLASITFGSPELAIGQPLRVSGSVVTVIGVAVPEFRGVTAPSLLGADVWWRRERGQHPSALRAFARLAPTVPIHATEARLRSMGVATASVDEGVIPAGLRSVAHLATLAVFVAVLALVAIVGMNVVALLLARLTVRQQDVEVRRALGASPWRAVAPFAFQGLVVALCAMALAVPISSGLMRALQHTFSADAAAIALTPTLPVSASWGAWLFGLAAAVAVVGASLVAPIRRAASARVVSPRLIAAQVAMGLFLLVVAGISARQVAAMAWRDPGFNTEQLAVIRLHRSSSDLATVRDSVRSIPGVVAAAAGTGVPLGREGEFVRLSDGRSSRLLGVDSDYFATLGQVIEGRGFDRSTSSRDVVVSQSVARAVWPEDVPLGKTITMGVEGRRTDFHVVGVVRDADPSAQTAEQRRQVYVPLATTNTRPASVIVRFSGPMPDVGKLMKRFGAALPPETTFEVESVDALVSKGTTPLVVAATVAGTVGMVAASVMLVGLFAVVSLDLVRRRKSIAVMVALGAEIRHVVRSVVKPLVWAILTGGAIAAVLGGLTVLAARRMLFSVGVPDLIVACAVAGAIAMAILFACAWPTWRAVREAPLESLREL